MGLGGPVDLQGQVVHLATKREFSGPPVRKSVSEGRLRSNVGESKNFRHDGRASKRICHLSCHAGIVRILP